MQITIDHKTNDAKTTNLGPHIARSSNKQGFEKLQTSLEIQKK